MAIKAVYKTSFQGYEYDMNIVHFLNYDYQKSKEKNEVFFDFPISKAEDLRYSLSTVFGNDICEYLDFPSLINNIKINVQELKDNREYSLFNYLSSDWKDTVLNESDIEGLPKSKAMHLSDYFSNKKIVIPAKKDDSKYNFSLIEYAK